MRCAKCGGEINEEDNKATTEESSVAQTDTGIVRMLDDFISRNESTYYAAVTIDLLKEISDLINRKDAEIENVKQERDIYFKLAFSQENKPTAAELAAEAEREHMRDEYIRRLKEEIEKLQNECFCIANERDAIADCLNTAAAEAVKEFAERLKAKAHRCDLSTDEHEYYSVGVIEIDIVKKEMVGED